jgi:hypothetical protein
MSMQLIPRESIAERLSVVPASLSADTVEDTPWWTGHQPSEDFECNISKILPDAPSWSKELRIWGMKGGNTISVFYRDETVSEVEEIGIRIDASKLSNDFVLRVCRWAAGLQCVFVERVFMANEYPLIEPDYFAVHEAIMKSRAMQFAKDPNAVLKDLKINEFEQRR